MSNVAALIDLIAQGKNAEASDLLNSELLARSYEKINDSKPEVASKYFAPVVDMAADGEVSYHYPDTEEDDQDETDS